VPEGEPLALARDLFGRDISIAAHRFDGEDTPNSLEILYWKSMCQMVIEKGMGAEPNPD